MILASHVVSSGDDIPFKYIALGILFVFMVILVLIGADQPTKCDVCGLPIKRSFHTWTISGKKQNLCPKCNSRLSHKVSKQAFKSRFGE